MAYQGPGPDAGEEMGSYGVPKPVSPSLIRRWTPAYRNPDEEYSSIPSQPVAPDFVSSTSLHGSPRFGDYDIEHPAAAPLSADNASLTRSVSALTPSEPRQQSPEIWVEESSVYSTFVADAAPPKLAQVAVRPCSPPLSASASPYMPIQQVRSSPGAGGARASRPRLERRTTVETRYMTMLLDQDKIPRFHNMCAHFFTWILLAGYLVFPATFVHWSSDIPDLTVLGNYLNTHVQNWPWLVVAAGACAIGVLGMMCLWVRHRKNYLWLINRIFLPGFTNALAGLISTLVNIYGAQKGQLSITAFSTIIVTGACSFVLALLFLLYHSWALSRVKAEHRRDLRDLQASEKFGDPYGARFASNGQRLV